MENYGASYEESDNNNISSNDPYLISNVVSKPTVKINSTIQIYEDVDIDKYMSLVEEELKKMDYSLDTRAFIANIINILDKLIYPAKFNKTIFFHILDFANLNRDSPILILDFFRSFFTVYESMRKNREKFAQEILNDSHKMETFKTKILRFLREEKYQQDGLTNNSSIRVKLINLVVDQNDFLNYKNHKGHLIKLKLKFGEEAQNLEIDYINKKTRFKLTSMEQIEQPIRIFLDYDGTEIYVGKVNVRDALDHQLSYKFSHQAMIFEVGFLWINSRVLYYNRQISVFDAKVEDNKENVHILNNCITHIEDTFKKYFSSIDNISSTKVASVNNIKGTIMQKELEVSQQIEDYVLKVVGQEVLMMDKIVYLINKFILILLILTVSSRNDFLTLSSCILLLAAEYNFMQKIHLYKILIMFLFSFVLDIIWILSSLSFWGMTLESDGNVKGSDLRDFCIIVNACIILIKIIFIFCLWRLALEYKLQFINKHIINAKKITPELYSKSENNITNSKDYLRKSVFKQNRPQLRASALTKNMRIPLRMYEDQDDFKR